MLPPLEAQGRNIQIEVDLPDLDSDRLEENKLTHVVAMTELSMANSAREILLSDQTMVGGKTWKQWRPFAMVDNYKQAGWFVSKFFLIINMVLDQT